MNIKWFLRLFTPITSVQKSINAKFLTEFSSRTIFHKKWNDIPIQKQTYYWICDSIVFIAPWTIGGIRILFMEENSRWTIVFLKNIQYTQANSSTVVPWDTTMYCYTCTRGFGMYICDVIEKTNFRKFNRGAKSSVLR